MSGTDPLVRQLGSGWDKLLHGTCATAAVVVAVVGAELGDPYLAAVLYNPAEKHLQQITLCICLHPVAVLEQVSRASAPCLRMWYVYVRANCVVQYN